MSQHDCPKVSIGLTVYNGERYLAEAVDSILGQTFTDFELILLDNASTDGTEAICRRYVEADPRVRYIRHPTNIGMAGNFNAAFAASKGKYFRWAAYDDVLAPTYLAKCVERLDADPTLVACHSLKRIIDENNATVGEEPEPKEIQSPIAHKRFDAIITIREYAIWALMRSDCLAHVRPHVPYASGVISLQAEIVLHGRYGIVPEILFSVRLHPGCYTMNEHTTDHQAWWGRSRFKSPRLMGFIGFYDHAVAVWRSPISWGQKLACWGHVARYAARDILAIVTRNGRRVAKRFRNPSRMRGKAGPASWDQSSERIMRNGKETAGNVRN